MKRISLLIVAILALAGCSKLEVYEANLFDGGDTYTLYTSNPDGSSQHTTTGYYALSSIGTYGQKLTGDNSITITLNPEKSDDSNVTYVIVKLTSNEMAWQKVGTTYSEGTWGSDYRHFVRFQWPTDQS